MSQSLNTQVLDNGNSFVYASRNRNENHILRLGLNSRLGETQSAKDEETEKEPKSAKAKVADSESKKVSTNKAETEKETPKGSTSKSDNNAKPEAEDNGEKAESESEADAKTTPPERYSAHVQVTGLGQGYPKFRALYSGPNSLAPPAGQAHATMTATGFFGLGLWDGGEAYLDPEIDQGFGLSDTHGVAGYPSAEAYKLGRAAPYMRFQRYFLRQMIGLGGESEQIDAGQNQLAGKVDSNRLTFTIGKYGIVDIFDDNKYAHDGRNGFMNWSIIDMGAFDYAADAWGFTHGATVEWRRDWWTARVGVFQMPQIPNGEVIEPVVFRQFSPVVEFEARHSLVFGQQGKIKFLGFGDLAYAGKWDEAVNVALLIGSTPDVTQIRRKRLKAGGGVNVEQPLTDDLGFFLRASMANGRYESLAFAEIERSLSAGVVLTGNQWGRPKDAVGVAGVINGISGSHARYLGAGGLGPFLGDGKLSYDGERILESYYKFNIMEGVHLTADYQFVSNPGYNRDRGSVSLFALRAHGEF